MKVKVSELSGAALDWAVAKCLANVHEDALLNGVIMHGWWISGLFTDPNYWIRAEEFNPSTKWSQGGPIIEREIRGRGLDLWSRCPPVPDGVCAATYGRGAPDSYVYGPTPLIAAMRCYVASKLGEEVEIPKELV